MNREGNSDPFEGLEDKSTNDYCPNCGHSDTVKRIDGTYILSELGSIFNFEKGFLFTVKELIRRPGKAVRTFVLHDRSKLVKPVIYVVVCSLVYTLLQNLLQFEDGYVNYSFQEGSTTTFMFEWITGNYGYANLIMALFIAGCTRILFRKSQFNIFEILILLCFVMGTAMLIYSIIGVLDTLISVQILNKGFLLGFLYTAWATGQFFDQKKVFSYIKAFFAYFLGMISFTLAVLIVGGLIDYIIAL